MREDENDDDSEDDDDDNNYDDSVGGKSLGFCFVSPTIHLKSERERENAWNHLMRGK